MSLFGSIQMAGNTLQAMQIGLHVVGNNIANANTPGFVRERVVYTPAPVQRLGNLTLGLGVEIAGIVQNIDKFAEERLRDAGSDRASAEVQEKAFGDLEAILGELGESDISTAITNFFNSLDEISGAPQDVAVRNFAVKAGNALAGTINKLSRKAETIHSDYGRQIEDLSTEINSLTERIRDLNLQIVNLEGSGGTSDAGGLRSERNNAIRRLAEIADIKATEIDTGAVNISLNGEILVFEGTRREVGVVFATSEGQETATVELLDTGSPLFVGGGELHGAYQARQNIVGGFLNRLDEFARALAWEFNKVYSQGQGITGFSAIESQNEVTSASEDLDEAGLNFTPTSGVFNVLVYNTNTKLTTSHEIRVDLDGLDNDSTLTSLAAAINAIDGVNAQVTSDLRLRIASDSGELRVAFEGDTSGVLAALGLNTFFNGSTAADITVNPELVADGSKFAASRAGIGVDVTNIHRLQALHDEGVDGLGGQSFTGLYDQLVNEAAQGAAAAAGVADGSRIFEETLAAAAQAVSGVNLDEEAIDMIMLQRTYQASARYISTLSDLFDVLVNL
jgi:flagellar hook-associated protein 1 FlgK